ncbi:hypothetical protein SMNI109538_21030 [Smaragdicoccus niigatensis]
MAEPTAPEIMSTVTRGAPCLNTPNPVAAPMKESAPTWETMPPTWIWMVTVMGMATKRVGMTATLHMKAHWRMNSANGNLRCQTSWARVAMDSPPMEIMRPPVSRDWRGCSRQYFFVHSDAAPYDEVLGALLVATTSDLLRAARGLPGEGVSEQVLR